MEYFESCYPLKTQVHSAWSVVHMGFLSSTVRDQAIGYMAVSGYSEDEEGDSIMDPTRSLTNPPVHLFGFDDTSNLKGLRIGIYWDWFLDSQSEVHVECKKIVETLVDQYGAELVNITIPHLELVNKAHTIIILSEWVQGDFKYINRESIKNHTDYEYTAATALTMTFAKSFDVVDLLSSMKIRRWLMQYFERVIFGEMDIDIIITPSTSVTAPKYVMESLDSSVSDMETVAKSTRMAFLANFLGIPGMSIPIGYSKMDGNGEEYKDGSMFPISLQMMANHWNEHQIFRVANLIEQSVAEKRKLPPRQNRFEYNL